MKLSVIIPTFNRKEAVQGALNSLKKQSLPANQFEVIIVDDGSEDDTPLVSRQQFPFPLTYLRQCNSGATIARNRGAERSRGDLLVFIDDDVTVTSNTLESMAELLESKTKVIVIGTLIQRSSRERARASDMLIADEASTCSQRESLLHFVECNTELLAIKRSDFYDLGMLQDPTLGRGWPNWDDVDFGYRAHLAGFRLLRSTEAIGFHWDYSRASLNAACDRSRRISRSAVLLFQKHPGLRQDLPMFRDMMPIDWRNDSPALILRKIARHPASSGPALLALEGFLLVAEKNHADGPLVRSLRRWIIGACVFRGFREGLAEFGSTDPGR